MRILILNQYFRPDASASARLLSQLAEDVALEHDVTVIAGRPSYEPQAGDASAVSGRLRVVRVPSTAFGRERTWLRIANYVSYQAAAVVAGLLARRPDVVVAGSDPPLTGVLGLAISRLRGVPLVHLAWDIHPQAILATGRRVPWNALLDRANRAVLSTAEGIVVPTANMAATVRDLGGAPHRITVIPHWEDLRAVRPGPRDNALSRREGFDDRFVIMYSGNLGLTQQLDRYIDLGRRLQDLEDVLLVFVGGGAVSGALQRQARAAGGSNIRFLPYQPSACISDLLACADLLLAPLGPGLTPYMLPSKVFTIMAAGRPVVAALDRSSDIAAIIETTGCGVVTAPGDVEQVEQGIRRLYGDASLRIAMGRRGRQAAEACFSRPTATGHYRRWLGQFVPAAECPVRDEAPRS